jgi:hypothetical protein
MTVGVPSSRAMKQQAASKEVPSSLSVGEASALGFLRNIGVND